jgi:trimethylguanosine synthase
MMLWRIIYLGDEQAELWKSGKTLPGSRRLSGAIVLDAFCGVGGSTIAFAKCKNRVISVDIDQRKLSMASNNAEIYGVAEKVSFIRNDIRYVIDDKSIKFDCIYFDPPWGGPEYYKLERFDLEMFNPDGRFLIEKAMHIGCPFAISLPKNFNLNQLFDYGESFFLEWDILNGVRLFATAYFKLSV